MTSYDKMLIASFENVFSSLIAESFIRFPSVRQVESWEQVLDKWINDRSLPLFVRKASGLRGSSIIHQKGRTLIITDNTPAQWIYRQVSLNDEKLTLADVKRALENRTFPLAMIIKQSEKEHLIRSQVSNGSFMLDGKVWK